MRSACVCRRNRKRTRATDDALKASARVYWRLARPSEIDDKAICREFTRRINAICMAVCLERFNGPHGTSQYIRFRPGVIFIDVHRHGSTQRATDELSRLRLYFSPSVVKQKTHEISLVIFRPTTAQRKALRKARGL